MDWRRAGLVGLLLGLIVPLAAWGHPPGSPRERPPGPFADAPSGLGPAEPPPPLPGPPQGPPPEGPPRPFPGEPPPPPKTSSWKEIEVAPQDAPPWAKNRQMWEAASPEERKALREKARALREEALRRLDGILQEKGLRLNHEQRRAFIHAYLQGRREIERTLRQRMQAEREKMEAALIDRLLQDVPTSARSEASADALQSPEEKDTPERSLPSPEPETTSSSGTPVLPFSAP